MITISNRKKIMPISKPTFQTFFHLLLCTPFCTFQAADYLSRMPATISAKAKKNHCFPINKHLHFSENSHGVRYYQ